MVLLGVDNAGKTTTLEQLKARFGAKADVCVYIYIYIYIHIYIYMYIASGVVRSWQLFVTVMRSCL